MTRQSKQDGGIEEKLVVGSRICKPYFRPSINWVFVCGWNHDKVSPSQRCPLAKLCLNRSFFFSNVSFVKIKVYMKVKRLSVACGGQMSNLECVIHMTIVLSKQTANPKSLGQERKVLSYFLIPQIRINMILPVSYLRSGTSC